MKHPPSIVRVNLHELEEIEPSEMLQQSIVKFNRFCFPTLPVKATVQASVIRINKLLRHSSVFILGTIITYKVCCIFMPITYHTTST